MIRPVLAGVLALAGAGAGLAAGYFVHEGKLHRVSLAPAPADENDAPSLRAERRPDFYFIDQDGVPRRMAHWDGRFVVINFWATWCPPCRGEMPVLVEAQKRYRGRGVQFVGLALDDMETVREYAREVSLNFPTGAGDAPLLDLMRSFGNPTQALPFTVLVAPDGRVIERHAGAFTREALGRLLDGLLAERGALGGRGA